MLFRLFYPDVSELIDQIAKCAAVDVLVFPIKMRDFRSKREAFISVVHQDIVVEKLSV